MTCEINATGLYSLIVNEGLLSVQSIFIEKLFLSIVPSLLIRKCVICSVNHRKTPKLSANQEQPLENTKFKDLLFMCCYNSQKAKVRINYLRADDTLWQGRTFLQPLLWLASLSWAQEVLILSFCLSGITLTSYGQHYLLKEKWPLCSQVLAVYWLSNATSSLCASI